MRRLLVACSLVLMLSGCAKPDFFEHTTVILGDTEYRVQIADSVSEWKRGLGKIDTIPENGGMLFVFEDVQVREFLMRDMRFSIDIVWIDELYAVVGAEEFVSHADQVSVYTSPNPVRYVLELRAGEYERAGRPKTIHVDGIQNMR